MEYDCKQVSAEQHCWVRERGRCNNTLLIEGISENGIYK